jgi:hypothetical protein
VSFYYQLQKFKVLIWLKQSIGFVMQKVIQLGILTVRHTLENIDGIFGYLSKNLRGQNNYVMANLMKSFMFSQDCPFILQLFKKSLISNLGSMDI